MFGHLTHENAKKQPVVKMWPVVCVLHCVAHIQLSRKKCKMDEKGIFWEDLFILKVKYGKRLRGKNKMFFCHDRPLYFLDIIAKHKKYLNKSAFVCLELHICQLEFCCLSISCQRLFQVKPVCHHFCLFFSPLAVGATGSPKTTQTLKALCVKLF